MGVGAGFGVDGIEMILTGTMHDRDPNASVPKRFAQRCSKADACRTSWVLVLQSGL